MKYLFLALIFCFSSAKSDAQKISFTDTTNEWYVLFNSTGYSTGYENHHYTSNHYYYSGTKTFDSVKYKRVSRVWKSVEHFVTNQRKDTAITYTNGIDDYFVREDTSDRKIYVRFSDTATIEHLLYDFDAKIDDTLAVPTDYFHAVRESVIDSTSMVTMNNQQYNLRTATFDGQVINGLPITYYYVDGIGSLSDPFLLTSWIGFRYTSTTKLICFKNQHGTIQSNDIVLNCTDTNNYKGLLNIGDIEQAKTLMIYPQPAHSYLQVELPKAIDATFTLYDNLGKKVYTTNINRQRSIRLKNIYVPAGLYFYKIHSKNAADNYSGKLLFN